MKTLRADGLETRARLKEAAQRLFALRGVEGVTVQEIVSAAGQRNSAALHYHFGSKRELLKELVLDGAQLIDARRQEMLDQMEATKTLTVRGVIEALAYPLLELGKKTGQYTYIRMIATVQLTDREVLREAVGDTWNTGYRRCLAHLRQLLHDIPSEVLHQRLTLVGIYGSSAWAAWEAAADSTGGSRFWEPAYSVSNVIDTLEAVMEAAPSQPTLAMIARINNSEHSTNLQ
ncbi:helix-turn-helix domain containing protein [Cupriavidus sp. WKF15]|uniref:TetR/AcrR family transcriptional regulator n=1 Tax=Cupriavidus sp. WKF15 TaxID=3032282 RepID=UPI0023E1C60A|nr:TetR/AcrR family transcriptional regulator [Cupriavidus sp. WKF15]WER50594.1 helix-turn-helix domain containing protein [Cupriavidus sp. WKF15]